MHFRMFEIARDHFSAAGYTILGGIISPVHDSYPKIDLAPAKHRLAMVKLGLQTSEWIRLSDWETLQVEWTRTRQVLQYHQNYINSFLMDSKGNNNSGYIPSWLPMNLLKNSGTDQIQVKLLCGADLLESFATPGLWKDEDVSVEQEDMHFFYTDLMFLFIDRSNFNAAWNCCCESTWEQSGKVYF